MKYLPIQNATLLFLLICSLLYMGPARGHAAQVSVAVATNFMAPAKELGRLFEKQTHHQLRFSFSSSGKLYAQIHQGAPFDVFLSADQVRPQKLVESGLATHSFNYAIGHLVLWAPRVDLGKQTRHDDFITVPNALLEVQTNKIALANPHLAPYGLAAQQALLRLNLKAKTKGKLVRGESVGQAYQFVHSGNAQMGFVALAQMASQPEGKHTWRVPEQLHAPIKQDAVLLKHGQNNPAARAFFEFLGSDEAQAIIQRFGYSVAPAP